MPPRLSPFGSLAGYLPRRCAQAEGRRAAKSSRWKRFYSRAQTEEASGAYEFGEQLQERRRRLHQGAHGGQQEGEFIIRKARRYVSLLEPDIGRRPINDIEPVEVLESLKKIERRGHRESANRTRALASRVFQHGIACSLCKSDPAAHLGDALATSIVTHRAAILDPDKFGQLLRDIDEFTGTPLVRIAMQLCLIS